MKTLKLSLSIAIIALFTFVNCTHDDYVPVEGTATEDFFSTSELLVKKFSNAPTFDGVIDDVWKEARPLVNSAYVSGAGDRIITLNGSSGGDTSLEPTDLMDPYTGESYNYSLRGGHDGQYLYLLFEWDDDTDSKDRQSWYFDEAAGTAGLWKQENKYANH